MRTIRLCAVVGGILSICLGSAYADDQFQILGDLSNFAEPEPAVATAYLEESEQFEDIAEPASAEPTQQSPAAGESQLAEETHLGGESQAVRTAEYEVQRTQFESLAEASLAGTSQVAATPQDVVPIAYQEELAPSPPGAAADLAAQPEPAVQGQSIVQQSGAYQYAGPSPGGPAVIHNGWGDVWNHWCGNWCCPGSIFVGVEGTFLVPVDEPDQRVILTDLLTGNSYRGETDSSLGAGIRTWLGLRQNCSGIRARYWFFGNDFIDNDPTVVPVSGRPVFNESYHLRAQTFDVELFHEFCFCHHTIDASLGARYAHLERNGTVTGYGTVGGVDLLGVAVGGNELEGTGLTASIGGRKPLGCHRRKDGCTTCTNCCPPCGWNFYWNYRGSVLWADSTVAVLTDATALLKPPIGAATATSRDQAFATQEHEDEVFISELQIGLEYVFGVCCLPGIFTARVGAEWQYWDTGELEARSNSFAALAGGPPPFAGQVDAYANAHDSNLDLIGFVLGLQYEF